MNQLNYPTNNIGRKLIPLTLINQNKGRKLYIYLTGVVLNKNKNEINSYYLSNINGDVTKFAPSDKSDAYGIEITETEQIIQLPQLSGMRFYFSYDKPLYTIVSNEGIPNAIIGWANDSNFDTLFDFLEFTWEDNDNDMTLGGNSTQVDMFGLAATLELTGFNAKGDSVTEESGFSIPDARTQIMNDFSKSPSPWNNLVISKDGTNLRVLSPPIGINFQKDGKNVFPSDQLDDYIDAVWKKYETDTLTASAEGVSFLGKVTNDILIFTPKKEGEEPIYFKKPSTIEVYQSGPLATQASGKSGVIRAALQAAFLRSTLLVRSKLPECDTSIFYQNESINQYAKIFHQYGVNNKAYTFGFDDVCEQSSVIIIHNPKSIKVTLLTV